MPDTAKNTIDIEAIVNDILGTIEREREREIISRRFGLFDRKETLEQIGELLGITRERVRQLEKVVISRLKNSGEKDLPHITDIQKDFVQHLINTGNVSRISNITTLFTEDNSRINQSRVSFLASLCPKLIVIDDNDNFYHSVAIASVHNERQLKDQVNAIVSSIKQLGKPATINVVAKLVKDSDIKHVGALASTSKQLATLNGTWGLVKWPTVNPKNIRDKIYVILHINGKPLHFNDIAKAIKASDFKRKDVTTQAIHNELIKDNRFVLIGRGIYALKEWGFSKGTVSDIITDVLKDAGEPLHRDEIVKRVLKSRQVKETTILLNLQGKAQFRRVAKATYTLAD
ncbi:hypothetical protein KDA11_06865 [Candidatus Saccharibacteria bacterium]|nr:hypothetical protein [Candidatus Saccharibacteria bacterium]